MVSLNSVFMVSRMVIHVDSDLHWKLSNLDPKTVLELNSDLSNDTAKQVSEAVSFLMDMTKSSLPLSNHVKRDSNRLLGRDMHSQILLDSVSGHYDSKTNHIGAYMVHVPSEMGIHQLPLLKRSLPVPSMQTLQKRQDINMPFSVKGGRIVFSNPTWLNSSANGLLRRDLKTWRRRFLDTVEDAFSLVSLVFNSVGIAFSVSFDFIIGLESLPKDSRSL